MTKGLGGTAPSGNATYEPSIGARRQEDEDSRVSLSFRSLCFKKIIRSRNVAPVVDYLLLSTECWENQVC